MNHFAVLACLVFLPAAPGDENEKAKALPAELMGSWRITKQEEHETFLKALPNLLAYQRFDFVNDTCTIHAKFVDAKFLTNKESLEVTCKLRPRPQSKPPAFDVLHEDGSVMWSFAYRLQEGDKLQLAKGFDYKTAPSGFDIKKDKITLLTCERVKPKQ
jgi:hypothetical protein